MKNFNAKHKLLFSGEFQRLRILITERRQDTKKEVNFEPPFVFHITS